MAREGGLMAWQWSTYDRNHRDKVNLCMHIIAVPVFIAAALACVMHLLRGEWYGAGISLAAMVFAFVVQGIGHKRETEPPIPFDGPGDFIGRVFVEQFITFPRFVLSGGWLRNLLHTSH